MRPTLAIDWDGTCVTAEWPHMSTTWMPGAVEALQELRKFARVVIHSSRIAPVEIDGMTKRHPALVQAEINYIREMLDSVGLTDVEIHTSPWKPSAVAYVDDKAVHYAGTKRSWTNIVPKLAAMCGVEEEVA